jgi:hypothetical protein
LEAVDHGLMAFWQQFAACWPEIVDGDTDPLTDHWLRARLAAEGQQWLTANVTPS